MSALADAPGPVRPGEELDTARLAEYLRTRGMGADGPVSVEQFRSGHSNLTYLARAGSREYVLRRPPFSSKVKSAHDMGREFRILDCLSRYYPHAPKPVLFCEDTSVLGAAFYLMERIQGVILRARKPDGLEVDAALARACCESFLKQLATLHAIDFRAAGLEELHRPGHFMARQTRGWSERYRGSQTDEISAMDTLISWLDAHVPSDSGTALIHNDYKFDNLVLDPADLARIIGVLDWEMCTIGDPLMDLGTSLSYWVEAGDRDEFKALQCFLTHAPGAYTRRQLAERYGEITGADTSNILFYYLLGLMKLAVIIQQIYYRYATGATQDERFAPMIFFVGMLAQHAVKTLELGTI